MSKFNLDISIEELKMRKLSVIGKVHCEKNMKENNYYNY